uniref:U6 small nuclear RNA (adenine-(43)-N(6))-methyltransferase n=1 Tax=Kwoniella pini CBS 10737 TaxID=1296096 RepID=A0A1B9IDM5_9TREE|nr:uncharacterized protein I206_00829 [Kwoniella pini CBS 10737]OCF53524.1 hypothetical protein I206_00829 [Kwoniella pini CBS 10737]
MHRDNPYLIKKPDFARLASRYPDFAQYVTISEEGYASIDFQDAPALRSLTSCLLKEDWNLDVELTEDRLCPAVSYSGLDYLFHVLDLEPYFASSSTNQPLRVLDIGTGASAIYPILLHRLRPKAKITATEIDEISYKYSLTVLSKNSIPSTSIEILRASSKQPILFPILDGNEEWNLTICNPPFFGSEEEMKEGQNGKERGAHAASTAANNELITPGGEVAFVGQMIEECLKSGERCCWYTSLIGKFSSLSPLVELLRKNKVDNYLLKNIKQSKTVRWILGWSFSSIRIPDTIARPEDVVPNTSFTRLLPPPNTFSHRPEPGIPIDELQKRVIEVLKSISLDPSNTSLDPAEYKVDDSETSTIILNPLSNSWSRSARRAQARLPSVPANDPEIEAEVQNEEKNAEAIFKAEMKFIPPLTSNDFSSISLEWIEGRDRTLVEGLWKFLLNKAELIGKKEERDAGYGARLGGGQWQRGKGRERERGRRNGGSKGGSDWPNKNERKEGEEDGMNENRRYGQRRRLV